MHQAMPACASPSSPSVGQRRMPVSQRPVAAGSSGAASRPPRRSRRSARATWRSAGSTSCRPSTAWTTGSGRSASWRRRGVRVLNGPSALLAAHDKLLTARLLHGAGLPHPHTRLVTAGEPPPPVDGPVVVKPRFGSWGRDVARCEGAGELATYLPTLAAEPWFHRHGALVQELVEPRRLRPAARRRGGRRRGRDRARRRAGRMAHERGARRAAPLDDAACRRGRDRARRRRGGRRRPDRRRSPAGRRRLDDRRAERRRRLHERVLARARRLRRRGLRAARLALGCPRLPASARPSATSPRSASSRAWRTEPRTNGSRSLLLDCHPARRRSSVG